LLLIWSVLPLAAPGRALRQASSPDDAQRLYSQATELYKAHRYDEAASLVERAIAINTQVLGPEHPDVALSLNLLAAICGQKGAYARAESLYQRAITIYSNVSSGKYSDARRTRATENLAGTLNNLASLYKGRGDYARAEPLFQRALAIYSNLSTGDYSDATRNDASESVAETLSQIALMYADKGDFERAEPLYLRALDISLKVQGAESPSVASRLNNLAVLYYEKGDYARAEPLYLRALNISVKVQGADPEVAQVLNNLGRLYSAKGDYTRAEPLFRRALAIQERALGPQDRDIATTLNHLAALYMAKGDSDAIVFLSRAVAILEKLDPQHPDFAETLFNLGVLLYQRGDYAHAEPLYLRSLAIQEKAFGPEHLRVATTLSNLANLYCAKGDYARAEPLYLRALAIRVRTVGPEHPSVAMVFGDLSAYYLAKGDYPRAVQNCQRWLEIGEHNLNLVLASGSEDQKQLYLNSLVGEAYFALSLHVRSAPADEQAARLVLTTILRRKGRALDVMTDQIATLRKRAAPQDQKLLDQLAAARSRLASLQLSSTDRLTVAERQAETSRLAATAAQLEDQVSRQSAQFRSLAQPVRLEAVRLALPADALLVEIATYKPWNLNALKASERYGLPRYVAYVLKRDAITPQFVELGSADSIDADVGNLRAAMQDPNRADVKDLARALDERVMRPIRKLFGSTHHILLSPDGALNLVPFAALVDEHGQYLVENYTISYLTSGRDLLRLQVARDSRGAPVVMGHPLFDMSTVRNQAPVVARPDNPTKQGTANRRSLDFTALTYPPLPGTAAEAKAVHATLPDSQLLLERQATEAALKQVGGPRILHIATHGFFLPDQPVEPNDSQARDLVQDHEPARPRQENPLLRSGLVLAGVKQQQSGPGEDGVLTALEAAGLDLWGTQLVVLSACDTGVGEVHNGAGVYGLRRALVLAGSETQVMSLWSVNDVATRDLMVGFYSRLQAGEGRAEALRQVQLGMLAGQAAGQTGDARGLTVNKRASGAPNLTHPYYWAPFIESGAWTGMAPPAR